MKLFTFLFISFFIFMFFTYSSYAHSGGGLIGDYVVSFTQEPLSPLVGDFVKVTITINDKNGQPVTDLKGKLLIKQLIVKQYVGKESDQDYNEIFSKQEKTGLNGNIALEYKFQEEAVYDVEFHWGEDEETQSTGMQIQPRNQSSFFSPTSAIENIWLLVGVATTGVIIGAIGTSILLTTTLHPKRL